MRLVPPGVDGEPLYEEELTVPPEISERSAAPADLKVMLYKHNRVVVQRPALVPLPAADARSIKVPWPETSLVAVSTTVGCLPDPDCRFTWLRVEVELGPDETDEPARPIACLLFPENGEDELQATNGVELTGELKADVAGLGSPGLGFVKRRETSGPTFRYRVVTYGQMGSTAAWDFRATQVRPEIAGDVALYLIVAMPSGRRSTGVIAISARAQLRSGGGAIPLIMRRDVRDVRANAFELSS